MMPAGTNIIMRLASINIYKVLSIAHQKYVLLLSSTVSFHMPALILTYKGKKIFLSQNLSLTRCAKYEIKTKCERLGSWWMQKDAISWSFCHLYPAAVPSSVSQISHNSLFQIQILLNILLWIMKITNFYSCSIIFFYLIRCSIKLLLLLYYYYQSLLVPPPLHLAWCNFFVSAYQLSPIFLAGGMPTYNLFHQTTALFL